MSSSANGTPSTPAKPTAITEKLTERELEILSKAWHCMKTTPEVDYAKLAAACGMTNTGSASNAWGKIKKKLGLDMPAGSTPASVTRSQKRPRAGGRAKKPGKPAKPASPVDVDGDEEDEDEADNLAEETPTKKRRVSKPKVSAAPVKKEAKIEDNVEDDEDDDELDAGEV